VLNQFDNVSCCFKGALIQFHVAKTCSGLSLTFKNLDDVLGHKVATTDPKFVPSTENCGHAYLGHNISEKISDKCQPHDNEGNAPPGVNAYWNITLPIWTEAGDVTCTNFLDDDACSKTLGRVKQHDNSDCRKDCCDKKLPDPYCGGGQCCDENCKWAQPQSYPFLPQTLKFTVTYTDGAKSFDVQFACEESFMGPCSMIGCAEAK